MVKKVEDESDFRQMTEFEKKLVLDHVWQAKKIADDAYKTATHALDKDELTSIAYRGLIQSAQRWISYCEEEKQAAKGYKWEDTQHFSKYSRLRIHGAIYDWLRVVDFVPRSLRAKSKKLRLAGQDQGASVMEMAERTGMDVEEINFIIWKMSNRSVSIEAEEIDFVTQQSTEESVVVNDLLSVVVDIIKEMELISQVVLAMHYYQNLQLQEITKVLNITDARATKIHREGVVKVRAALSSSVEREDLLS